MRGDGTPVFGASVALAELGLGASTGLDGRFSFDVLFESRSLDLTVGAMLDGRRVSGAAEVVLAPQAVVLDDVLLGATRENVLVFGSLRDGQALEENLLALGLRPERVTWLPALPTDLSHYAVVWQAGRQPTAQEQTRLAGFLAGGGGLHLSGITPFPAFQDFLNELVATDEITIPQASASGAHAFNPGAVGEVATVPNALTQFGSITGTRNLLGVGDHNVLVARTGGQVFGGAWDSSNLTGGQGRLTVVMSNSWVEPGESLDVLENLLTFLQREPKAAAVR